MQRAYSRGWPTKYRNGQWVYSDTLEPDDGSRPCRRCGRGPTKDGHDACLGKIEDATSACCGHGAEKPYSVRRAKKPDDSDWLEIDPDKVAHFFQECCDCGLKHKVLVRDRDGKVQLLFQRVDDILDVSTIEQENRK